MYRQWKDSTWYSGALASFLSSSQQQIALRSNTGGGVGRRLLYSRHGNLDLAGGIVYTHQTAEGGPSRPGGVEHSVDGAIDIESTIERFAAVTFTTSTWIYPGLSDAGRYRINLNESLYYKLKLGIYTRLSFYDYFDNQVQAGAHRNSLGDIASAGWSFH